MTTKYTVFGDKVSFETTGSDKVHYSYDASGNLFSMNLNGTEYYYVRNAQGDITGLIDNTGNIVVSYTYDTWGKLISTTGSLASTLGVKNPYRYRGYRYDTETGLYYLQSRFYNPDWGRFVNADGLTGINGELLSHNIFAYCVNNPVNMEDPSGYYYRWNTNYRFFIATISALLKGSLSSSLIFAVLPYVAIGIGVVGIGIVGWTLYKFASNAKKASIVASTSIKRQEKQTLIYRYGSNSNTNLTPRPQDLTGLSFSLTPPKNGKYVVTTIQAVNASGVLRALKDGPNHVSVFPTIITTIDDWIASRPNAQSNPHPYTIILKSISLGQ